MAYGFLGFCEKLVIFSSAFFGMGFEVVATFAHFIPLLRRRHFLPWKKLV
jgi:hypothetical protein